MTNTPTDRDLFDGFRQLMAECGPTVNKHDLVNVLISACIDQGLNTGPRIVGALDALGFNRRHVGMLLKEGRGEEAERHTWKRNQQGQYTLHKRTATKPKG
jgi:hypothetical protein